MTLSRNSFACQSFSSFQASFSLLRALPRHHPAHFSSNARNCAEHVERAFSSQQPTTTGHPRALPFRCTSSVISKGRFERFAQIQSVGMKAESSVLTINQENGMPSNPTDVEINTPEEVWKPQKQEYLVMLCLSIVSLIVALDSTILVPALPTIARSLNGDTTQTFWAGTSYLLTSATFQPCITALSDIFGRRELLLVSLSLFTLGTIVCCIAHNFTQLLVGRSVQGVGGGGIIAMVLVIFTDIVPLRQRPKYNGFAQLAWAIGTISGPLIGGAFAEYASWPWIFYINFPFCAAGLLMTPLVVKLKKPQAGLRLMLSRVDWIGSFLFIASMTSFLIAITWGGVQFPWKSWRTLVPLVLGILGIGLTVAWDNWGAKSPFLRLAIFRNSSAIAAYVCTGIQGILLYATLYYLSLYLQAIQNLSPTMNGVVLLPVTCGLLPASIVVSILMSRYGRFRWSVWAGWVVSTTATGLLCLLNTETTAASYVFIFLVCGLGHGLLLSSLSFAVQAISTTQDVAYAAGLYSFIRSLGLCLGVAIGGTVFQNFLSRYLAEASLPTAISNDAEAFVQVLQTLQPSEYRDNVREAFVRAFNLLFGIMTAFSGVAGLVSLAVGKHDMDKVLDSEHVLEQKDIIKMEVVR